MGTYERPQDLVTIREAVDWLNAEAERTGSAARYTDQNIRGWISGGVNDRMATVTAGGGVKRFRRVLPTHRIPPNVTKALVSKRELLDFIAKTGRDIARNAPKESGYRRRNVIGTAINQDDAVGQGVLAVREELKAKGIEMSLAGVAHLLISEALRARGALK